MTTLFRLLSHLPLWLLHGLGWLLGWATWLLSSGYRRRFLENVALAGVARGDWLRAVGAAGCVLAELPRLWLGKPVPVRWQGVEHLEAALAAGRGIVFLTPHMGSFEVTGQAYAARFGVNGHPMTVLYRPPRKAWLRTLVMQSRQRPGLAMAPASLQGVKQLLKALKAGQCVGLLPDQVPPDGMGVWATFFGKPAYTMTLSARLALQSGASVLLGRGERLGGGRGYVFHVYPLGQDLSGDLAEATTQINQAMERLIGYQPSQYLWGYARYKAPRREMP